MQIQKPWQQIQWERSQTPIARWVGQHKQDIEYDGLLHRRGEGKVWHGRKLIAMWDYHTDAWTTTDEAAMVMSEVMLREFKQSLQDPTGRWRSPDAMRD